MARLPDDPTRSQWLRYAVGGRLPAAQREWVRHDLTDAGWRLRLLGRIALLLVPFAVVFALLPGIDALSRMLLVALIFLSMLITIGAASDQLRERKLRQHGLPVPRDPDADHREQRPYRY